MPRNYKRKLGSRRYADYTPEALAECVAKIRNGQLTYRKAEEQYKIPLRTLVNKVKGLHSKAPGKPPIFTTEEESTFVKCIIDMSNFGFPVDVFDLRCIISADLQRIGRTVKEFVSNFPGTEWTRSFLKRHPQLTVRFAANIKKTRAAIDENTLTNFINNLKVTLEGVPPGIMMKQTW